jgi:phosphoribosylformimino-5-aminoimidazole carboxamide ribotide isomerase
MIVIPAVDIRGGRCVRLVRGKPHAELVFSNDPVAVAVRWEEQGARYLHVVDLDGAFEGAPINISVVQNIVSSLSIPTQVGGGVRSEETVERLLEAGVARVILGTRALDSPDWLGELCERFSGHVVASVDSVEGKVAVRGWTVVADTSVTELLERLAKVPLAAIVYTDTSRDGTLTGPHFEQVAKVAGSTTIPVIAAGGVTTLEDVRRLAEMDLEGAIIGRALYEGTLTLADANRVACQASR